VPFVDWTGPQAPGLKVVTSTLLFVKLLIGFPLNMMVVFYSFQTCKFTRDLVPQGSVANKVMRLCVAALSIIIAQMIPDFGQLFALVMAVFGPIVHCLLPLHLGYKIRHALGAGKSSIQRRVFHGFMVVVAVFTLTIGTSSAIQDIMAV